MKDLEAQLTAAMRSAFRTYPPTPFLKEGGVGCWVGVSHLLSGRKSKMLARRSLLLAEKKARKLDHSTPPLADKRVRIIAHNSPPL